MSRGGAYHRDTDGRDHARLYECDLEFPAVEVPEEHIRDAVRLLFGLANLKAEPTGALSIGALITEPERFRDQRVCCVISGGNVDGAVYRQILAG